jgi:SAM-dependent methyltransferase
VVAVVSDARRTKRLFAEAYDASATGFARSADRLVYTYLARPLARALGEAAGPVLDVAAGSGALGRLLPAAVALDLSAAQLRHNPLPARLRGDAERLPFRDDAFAAAGCAFGVNHFPDPGAAVAEMARVAPLVGLLTWVRPETPYRPKQAVLEVVARHAGSGRTAAGILADEFGDGFTPGFPAYVSGHSTFGAAVFRTLENFYGTDAIPFTLSSDELPGVTRSFTSFSHAAAENGDSRIYLGVHWRFDDTYGQQTGRAIADHVFDNDFGPVG